MRKPCHRLVGDEKLRFRSHGAGEFKFAHFDLGEVARQASRLVAEANLVQKGGATLLHLARSMVTAAAHRHRIEQWDADIVGQTQACERTRQLETACQSPMSALMRVEPIKLLAGEAHAAEFVA